MRPPSLSHRTPSGPTVSCGVPAGGSMGSTRSLTSVMNALICLAELSGNLLDDGRAFAFRASASMPVTTRRTFRRSVALRCPAHPLPRPPCLYSSSSAEIYIRRNPTVWVPAGTLGGYGAAVRRFPDATHKLGMKNPGRGMQTIFRNGWNRGTRITLFPPLSHGQPCDHAAPERNN